MLPACETPFVAGLSWMCFYGRIGKNNITANGLSAITAGYAASTEERFFNPLKTAGAIVLHGSPLVFQLLLIGDKRFVNESQSKVRQEDLAQVRPRSTHQAEKHQMGPLNARTASGRLMRRRWLSQSESQLPRRSFELGCWRRSPRCIYGVFVARCQETTSGQ